MIRDLRSGPPRTAAPPSDAVAFSRESIMALGRRPSAEESIGAFTIAVTAPRTAKCKRGVAAHIAAYLANTKAEAGLTACVLDVDVESRDVGLRFGVTGPTLFDVVNDMSLRDDPEKLIASLARVDPPGLTVVPIQMPSGPLLPLLQTKAVTLLDQLRAAFDFVVVDLPVGFGTSGAEWERAILERVDGLLVAVSAEPSAFGGALRYLTTIGASRSRGGLPNTFDTHLVLTGTEEDGSRSLLTERALDRNLPGVPVVASIPQLWGRRVPDVAEHVSVSTRLHEEFGAIMTALTGITGH